jgi:hypothetical protein
VLVHRRDADDKLGEEAELHRVQSMLAAGWGGTASVTFAGRIPAHVAKQSDMLLINRHYMAGPSEVQFSMRAPDQAMLVQEPPAAYPDVSDVQQLLGRIAELVTAQLSQGKPLHELSVQWPRLDLDREVTNAMAELRLLVADQATAWLLLALWVASRKGEDGNVYFAAVLEPYASGIDRSTRDRVNALLTQRLAGRAAIDWVASRLHRLRRNLR